MMTLVVPSMDKHCQHEALLLARHLRLASLLLFSSVPYAAVPGVARDGLAGLAPEMVG